MSKQRRGELRRLIKEFVANDALGEVSVDDVSAFLLKYHGAVVQSEKTRLFHNSIADIARDVLRSPQLSQQLLFPGFPENLQLPARISIHSPTKGGKPIWKRPIGLTGLELTAKIAELKKPHRASKELEGLEFIMTLLISELGEIEARRTSRTVEEILEVGSQKK